MKQYGLVAILCIFGIILILLLLGVSFTMDSFIRSFRAGDSAFGEFLVFFFTFLKWACVVGGALGGLYCLPKIYWGFHKILTPTPEGNYPILVSPVTKSPLLLSPGNGPVPGNYHYHQDIDYAEPKQIAASTTVQQLPSAPPFAQIAHLITPEHLPLNYIASGPVYGQVDDLLSMALIGKPKRGKTTSLLYYLCILLRAGAEVWIWDPHGEMSELAYGLHYFSDLDDIATSAVDLMAELDDRSKLYKRNKQVKHPLVLLVDEIPVIADWEQDMKKQKIELPASPYRVMKRFTLEARKWRGFVFISGQSLPANVLPTLTRDNLSSRLVLECSADHARMIGLPKDTIDTLLPLLKGAERGTHIADFSSWSRPELADIPYTTIDDLRAIIDDRGTWGKRESAWGSPVEPLDDFPNFPQETQPTFHAQHEASNIVTGELLEDVDQPVEVFPDTGEVPPDERLQIITIARMQLSVYGKVKRSEIPAQMGKNNRYYAVVKQVLDEEGL